MGGMKGIPVLDKPIRPQKLYEQVAHRLETRILEQTYSPGDLIPSERDLMREFGVGRPAVREALFHLKNMGLIELRSGERAMVTRPTAGVVVESLAGVARHMLAQSDGVKNFQDARMGDPPCEAASQSQPDARCRHRLDSRNLGKRSAT